jgi:beta-glucanase (GH16 family)
VTGERARGTPRQHRWGVSGGPPLTCRPVPTPDRQVTARPRPVGSHGRRPLAVLASTLVAAALLTTAPDAASASGLRIHAAAGGRLSAHLVAAAAPGTLNYVLDDRRVRQTRRREISIRVPRRRTGRSSRAVWRTLAVHRAGSRRVLAKARFAMARRGSRRAPTLVLLAAPRPRTKRTTAVLRFNTTPGKTSCGRDGAAVQPCSSPVSHERLSPGSHTFRVRTANRHGTTAIRVASTVVADPPSPALPLPAGPTPDDPTSVAPAFSDDFDGRALNTANWSRYSGPGNGGNGLRRPEAISLDGKGNLVITAQMVNGQLVSGGMALGRNDTYGRYEVRVRTDPDPTGTTSGVVLTWPESGRWPQDGENDIYETGNSPGTRPSFGSFVHYGADNRQHYFVHLADPAQWHTMAMDWDPNAIRIYRDGVLVWTLTDTAAIPDVAHHLCIQLDAMVAGNLTTPVRMYVDYVRIYTRN